MNHPSIAGKAGFTLAEVIVTMGVAAVLAVGTYSLTTQTGLIMYESEEKININRDIRAVTNQMSTLAREANHAILYTSYDKARRALAHADNEEVERQDGEAGDFLALFWSTPEFPADPQSSRIISRIVGFYRSGDVSTVDGVIGPVRKFDTLELLDDDGGVPDGVIPPEESQGLGTNVYWALLAKYAPLADKDSDKHRVVLEIARGLANNRLFFKYTQRAIVVNGQIIHGSAAKEVTNTYNFTISPQG